MDGRGRVENEGVGERELKREGVNAGLRRESDALCCVVCRGKREEGWARERERREEVEGRVRKWW